MLGLKLTHFSKITGVSGLVEEMTGPRNLKRKRKKI